ncbi:MAG: endonuclease domain-containing protein [Bacteroidales bacterium]|jgi:very-short-patch-repair endonuclease|nr:endonuclease domain-containing protein [Bacteroidales bacterium]MDD3858759.1 endonuclease domain-containing protein [Bacteroidales bacterium]HOZ30207.1 endonuclease domain-containing protein [Bacteroidales bacterium]
MQNSNELNKVTMFYGASSLIMDRAKQLRRRMTKPENIVWEIVRENAILGLKFRRQHPISNYIADFYCHKIKLVIEIDGATHHQESAKLYDEHRTNVMNSFGIEVIRFSNKDILSDITFVKKTIQIKCKGLLKE